LRLLDEFAVLHRRGALPPDEAAALAGLRARLLLAAGRPDDAEAALAPVRGRPPAAVAEALVRLARGEPEAAVEVLAARPQTARHVADALERTAVAAVALDTAGDRTGAGRTLEQALCEAEAAGVRAPFAELGRRMEELLRQRIRDGTAHRALAGQLLDVFAGRAPAPRSIAPLLEPLSEREETLLRYLPTTLSNREIAAELFVTTNTVKTHLRNIYRKLDVAHRREAVQRARDLRLLSATSRR
jgi:LuxR family maltose regulon positive regulatory protein